MSATATGSAGHAVHLRAAAAPRTTPASPALPRPAHARPKPISPTTGRSVPPTANGNATSGHAASHHARPSRTAQNVASRKPAPNHHRASAHSPSPNSAYGKPKTAMPGRYGLKSASTAGSVTYVLPVAASNSADRSTTRTSNCPCPVSTRAVRGNSTAPTAATPTGRNRIRPSVLGRVAAHAAVPYPHAAVSAQARCGPSSETSPKRSELAAHTIHRPVSRRARSESAALMPCARSCRTKS